MNIVENSIIEEEQSSSTSQNNTSSSAMSNEQQQDVQIEIKRKSTVHLPGKSSAEDSDTLQLSRKSSVGRRSMAAGLEDKRQDKKLIYQIDEASSSRESSNMDITHQQLDGSRRSSLGMRRQSLMMRANQGRVQRAESFGISDESSFTELNHQPFMYRNSLKQKGKLQEMEFDYDDNDTDSPHKYLSSKRE